MLAFVWNTLIFGPVVNTLLLLYSLFGRNLGWAIIVLTVILKILLYPLTKKQMESSQKIKVIQPQLEKIQKKYKRNPKKIQEEQLKLYKKVGYNPLGCLFSVILPLPILIAIYQAIMVFSSGEITGIYQFVKDIIGLDGKVDIKTYFYVMDLSKSYLPIAKEIGYVALKSIPYLLLAVLTGISQYYSVKLAAVTKRDKRKKKSEQEEMAESMSKSMSFTFPIMTTLIALSMPAAVSLYWVVQSWLTVVLQFGYNKMSQKKDEK